ncbi:hypothetical protein AMTRI_Chr03g55130 [Amborella trichopoda]
MLSLFFFFLSPLSTLLVPFIRGSIRYPLMTKTQHGATHRAISLSSPSLFYLSLFSF